MSRGIGSYERPQNPKSPIKAYNTTLTRGGARNHLYPEATGWEGIDAARDRQRNQSRPLDPEMAIWHNIASLRERLDTLLRPDTVVDPKKTKNKIRRVRELIREYSGDKTRFLESLTDLEAGFSRKN